MNTYLTRAAGSTRAGARLVAGLPARLVAGLPARLVARLPNRLRVRLPARGDDRGDVPGWVMVTLMTAGLVLTLWAVAGPRLEGVFNDAMDHVVGGP